MKYIRTLLAAVAAASVALLLGLLGASTAAAQDASVDCPKVNTDVVDADCKAKATGDGANVDANVDTPLISIDCNNILFANSAKCKVN